MAESDKELEFTEFRPYEEKDSNLPLPNKGKTSNIQINVGNTRIVFQKTPPPTKRQVTNTQPKKIPRIDSWSGRGQGSVSASISQVSAVGMTTGSVPVSVQQSHRSVVEEQLGIMKMSSKPSTDRHWMPDKLCHQCSECEVKFSVFIRRHHCRICGRIFCNSCSSSSIPGHHLRPPIPGKVRVCSACLAIFFEMHTSQSNADVNQAVPVTPSARGRSHSVSSDRQDSPERLDSISAISFNPSIVQSRVSWDDGSLTDADIINSPSRLGSIGIEFDNPTPLRQGHKRRLSKDENILALQEDEIDVRLQEIWSKFTDKAIGLAPQTRRHRFGIRAFQNAYIAQEIVDWLIENNHAYTREMGIRIGQTFIDTKYLTVVSSPDQIFRDSKDIILEIDESGSLSPLATSPTLMDAPNWFLSEEGGDDSGSSSHDPYNHRGSLNEAKVDVESGQAMFQKTPSQTRFNIPSGNLFNPPPKNGSLSPPVVLNLDEADEDRTENGGEPSNKNTTGDNESFFVQNYFSKDDVATPTMEGCLFPPAINQPANSTMTSYSVLTPNSVLQAFPLTQASHFVSDSEGVSIQSEIKQQHISEHQIHLEKFLTQQLISFSLSLSWLEYIQPLILEASRKVSTYVLPDDFMDFESYCKVKKIPGGRKASCSFIHGAVFSKHVSHKKMDMSLRNPRILMLKCAMEFQRRENQMSSFDTLMLQEQEYLKNLVERVKTFQPDIILVQKSVARFALEMFHHHRIVVVVNIKPSVMARVARSTEGDLLSNLDQLYFNVKLGTCGRFYVRTFTLPDASRKTLMYFDECEPKLGGVILLQGSDNQELKKVKKVVKFGLQIAHNMMLESAFLTDEFAVSSKKMSSKCEMAEDYVTPPASPELYFYPFSTTMFDEPAKNNPPEDVIVMNLEDETAVVEKNGINSMENIELESEGVSEGVSEAVCPIPVPVNETEAPLSVAEDEPDEVDGEKEESTVNSKQLLEPPTVGTGGSGAGSDVEPSTGPSTGSNMGPNTGSGIGSSTGCNTKSSEMVFQSVLESHLMSTSPHVMFKVPYLEREQSNHAHIKMYLPDVVYWSHWFRPRAKHIPIDSLVHSAYVRKKSMQAMTNANDKGHTYKSVSSHPFVKSSFLHPANSDEIKSALADFRARASHPDEPDCFFFPSARKATDTAAQLQKVFARSRRFEEKAKNYHILQKRKQLTIDLPNEGKLEEEEPSTSTSDPQSAGLSKRTTRWTVPEKEAHRPSTPVKKHSPEQIPIIAEPDPEPVMDPVDFSKVFERDRGTPEPVVLIPPTTMTTDVTASQSDKELGMMSDEQIDCLDPFNHQSISLVFSSTCHDKTKHLYPCVPPCIIPMSYYGRNDIPFGEFLHRYCFRENYICQSCNVDMSTHQRHFVHGGAELRITMQQLGASIPGGDKSIFTWSTCPQCRKQSTPLVPLSMDSLHFSFAKFLELKFYANDYNCFNFNEEGHPPKCTHPIHSYVQFFSYQDKVATFELFPVKMFEVRVPLQNIQLNPSQVVHHDYFREISHLSKLIESVFYHMKKYVEVYNIEPLQERTKKTMDRFLGMRDMLRMKVKQLKDISVECGLSGHDIRERDKDNFSMLQDSLAELKRSLADTVDCFNKDLCEVDCKLREIMAKKDPSPRDTPLSATVESDSSPKSSPRLAQKQVDKSSKVNSTGSDEAKDSRHLEILRHHRRQHSDTAAVCKVSESSGDDVDGGGGHGMGKHNGSDSQLSLSQDRDEDLVLIDKLCSSSSSSFDACDDDGGELVSAVRESVDSDTVMAVVYSTQDIMTKIRGKEIEDPTKFYHLRSTTISSHTASGDYSDFKSSHQPSKKAHNAASTSKIEELDNNSNSGGGIRSKISSDKLTNLLSKPFHKLPTPFEATEHHLLRGKLRFQISVYENEPTSIIAFALCSREYAHELKLLVEEARKIGLSESVVMQASPRGSEGDVPANPAKPTGFIKNVISEIRKKKLQSSVSVPTPPEDAHLESAHYGLEQSGTLGDDATNIQWNGAPDTSDRFSSSHEQKHISLEFADDTTKFFCKAYYAEEFRKLRELLHLEGDDSYIRSLARCVRYEAKGGKSKSMFLKTFEDQLIMKQVQLVEITSFIEIAPEYFKHVTDAIKEKRPMVLAKILGAYSIGFRNTKTGRSKRHNVIIMENLLYNHKCTKVFDLKGSMRGRYVMQDPKKDGKGDVLMDENFLEFVYTDPVYVRPHAKAVLMQAIESDTLFLSKNSIMDYSLLTGLDEEKGELVVGIIDFVRPFTLDKRLEMIFKKTGRSVLPTVVYPDLYQKRFIEAMDRYFSPIPDKWTGLGADIRVSY